jgi:hypothetical protein
MFIVVAPLTRTAPRLAVIAVFVLNFLKPALVVIACRTVWAMMTIRFVMRTTVFTVLTVAMIAA